MKETYYFSHDSNARTDNKILLIRAKYGAKGYGIYFMIIEMLREANAYQMLSNYSAIAYELHEPETEIKDIIENYGLFKIEKGYFWSESLKERMTKREEIIKKRTEAGRKGGQANAKQMLSKCSTIAQPLKESKVKESKVNINTLEPDEASGDVKEILEYFKSMNELSRIVFNAGKKQKILARLKNFSKDDLKKAIENRSKDAFMKGDNQDSKEYRKDFNSLFRSDEQVEKWLNRKSVNPLTLLKNV